MILLTDLFSCDCGLMITAIAIFTGIVVTFFAAFNIWQYINIDSRMKNIDEKTSYIDLKNKGIEIKTKELEILISENKKSLEINEAMIELTNAYIFFKQNNQKSYEKSYKSVVLVNHIFIKYNYKRGIGRCKSLIKRIKEIIPNIEDIINDSSE